ncbi:MAG TPA: hypothetical protein VJA26_17930 [Gammaproteobacteria bacterium]|nr:hypothetical protein [Gammaproteobacteria bacterium]
MSRLVRLSCLAAIFAATAEAQQDDVELNLLHVQGNVYMLHGGAAGNIAVQIWIRHADILTVLVRSQNWFLDPGQQVPQFYCEYVTELPPVTEDSVPHHLPGQNVNLTEVAGWYGLPLEVLRGGAEKMYPQYRHAIPPPESPPPAMCERFCNCSDFFSCL